MVSDDNFLKIAAVVVLYRPTSELIDTIGTYYNQVEKVYIVDNSERRDSSITNQLTKFANGHYIFNGGNKGIAHALNVGANMALKEGFQLLLTMDQDTTLHNNYVFELVKVFKRFPSDKVGIASPVYAGSKAKNIAEYQPLLITMTSGNVLNLKVYHRNGPFLEALFIDHVDHEYCLRLNKNGFLVIQVNGLRILHRPGKLTTVNLLGFKHTFSSHSPVRLYYFCRNGYFVSAKYHMLFPEFKKMFMKLLLKEILKIPLQTDKARRIRLLIKSVQHYRKGIMGPFTEGRL